MRPVLEARGPSLATSLSGAGITYRLLLAPGAPPFEDRPQRARIAVTLRDHFSNYRHPKLIDQFAHLRLKSIDEPHDFARVLLSEA
jgi:hypothetical protein